jgi:hypothetical protein
MQHRTWGFAAVGVAAVGSLRRMGPRRRSPPPITEPSVRIRCDRGAKLSLSMEEQKAQGQPQATATAGGSYTLTSVNALATGSFEARVTLPTTPVINKPGLWAQCQTPAPSHQRTQYISILVHTAWYGPWSYAARSSVSAASDADLNRSTL